MEDQGHLLWLGVKNVFIFFSFQFFSKVLMSGADLLKNHNIGRNLGKGKLNDRQEEG